MKEAAVEGQAKRVAADWEQVVACWTAWPCHRYAWGRHLEAAQAEVAALCRAIASAHGAGAEQIVLLVDDEAAETQARQHLGDLAPARLRYQRLRYGDIWLRDTAPLFVWDRGALTCTGFAWNGWGNKYLYPNDADLCERIAASLGFRFRRLSLTLEGGALEVDGEGTCITTEQCVLNSNRNPQLARARFSELAADAFGISRVLWLGHGLRGDHTDGHIDNLARFCAAGRVLYMESDRANDPNREVLHAAKEALAQARDARGRRLELCPVPSPGLVEGDDGVLAASYLNFYVGNGRVVVPAFAKPQDERARRAIAAAFPDREVLSSPALALLQGGGTFHCITRGQPSA